MSPSGKHVAATAKVGPNGRLGLVVFDVADLSKSKAIVLYANADVVDINWVNDDRIAYDSFDYSAVAADQQIRTMYAVDREGKKEPRNLQIFNLFATTNDGSNDVIYVRRVQDGGGPTRSTRLMRLSTVDAERKEISRGAPEHVRAWALDWQSNPRVAIQYADERARLYWKKTVSAPWTIAREWNVFADQHASPAPLAVDNQDRLYVIARDEKSDFNWLYRVDMKSDVPEWKALVSLEGYDFMGGVILGQDGQLLGIRHLTDVWSTTWVDPAMKDIQSAVDRVYKTTTNQISCGRCVDPKKVLVRSWSDRQPSVYSLYDVATKKVEVLGNSRPWIKADQMATRTFTTFKAQDGMTIPVHLTKPRGASKPLPAVVLVHGGPFIRGGTWQWDAESQLLASRGYVVIEPEFRGSDGFGFKHFRAGWKQWGLGMQDDVADSVRWAVAAGHVDPKRVCIAGASYGGYATMMGLIRHPELFRCGIAWSAVTDLELLLNARWSDMSENFRDYGAPLLIGDVDKDSAQLKATSPLHQAARIKRPLLLAHGGEDGRVTVYQAARLRSALEKHNVPHEWILYKDEAHGWLLEKTRIDFWTKVEAFLAKHNGPEK
ncbi:MAG: alpha/beta hydrolase family protein [Burkholderiales bacterium]